MIELLAFVLLCKDVPVWFNNLVIVIACVRLGYKLSLILGKILK